MGASCSCRSSTLGATHSPTNNNYFGTISRLGEDVDSFVAQPSRRVRGLPWRTRRSSRTRSTSPGNVSPIITTTNSLLDQQQINDELEHMQYELLMESFLQSFLPGNNQNNSTFNPFAALHRQVVNSEPENHPASQKAIRQLPILLLTAEDLADESNRECCICIEEHNIGGHVCRLPCGHIFHRPCITEWLEKHNSCCICRYELETDDAAYEKIRREKMKNRRPRYREYELKRMSVSDLRQLTLRLSIKNYAAEKNELVNTIIQSGKIDLIAPPEPVEYKLSELQTMSVMQLTKTMNERGFFFDQDHVVEKEGSFSTTLATISSLSSPIPAV